MSGEPQLEESTRVIRTTVRGYAYSRSVHEVHQEFGQLDPAAIGDACAAWKRAADELVVLADDLRTQAAAPLDTAWQDTGSSAKAQTQLQYAEATARALANDCLTMAHATDYAAQYAQWYKDNLPSYTDSVLTGFGGLVTGDGLDAGAEQAVTHMVRLLGRYNEVIATLPPQLQAIVSHSAVDQVTLDRPPGGGAGVPAISGPAGGGAGFAATGTAGAGGPDAAGLVAGAPGAGSGAHGIGSGVSGAGGAGTAGGAGSGYDPYAPGTSLAGGASGGGLGSFDPVGAAGGLGAGLGSSSGAGLGGTGGALGAGLLGAAGLGAGGLSAGGLSAGLGRAGSGSGLAGAGAAGAGAGGIAPGGVIGGPGGAGAGGAAATGGRGAGRAGAAGAAGVPAHGGQGDEEERERSTWLLEDDDVWSGDGDVPPPVIGG